MSQPLDQRRSNGIAFSFSTKLPELALRVPATRYCAQAGIAALAAAILATGTTHSHAAFKIAPTEVAGRYFAHVTVLGDTLNALKVRYLKPAASVEALQKLNNIRNPNLLGIGREIRIPVAMLREEAAPARIVALSGRADTSSNTGSVGSTPARVGDSVSTGDKVRTAEDSFIALQLADGSVLLVQPKSQVEIEAANSYANTGGVGDTIVRVNAGRVETRVAKQRGPAARYEIRTATSNMGVRGTVFRVAADASGLRAQSEVIEGRVGVTASTAVAQELSLDAGFGTIIAAGKLPSAPIALLPAPQTTGLSTVFESPTVVFTVKPVSQAATYSAQVALDPQFRDVVAVTDSATPQLTFQNLPDGDLYLRIRAVDAQQLQGNDAALKFSVRARPFAPQLAINAKPMATANLAWRPVSDAGAYRVQIAGNETFQSLFADAKVDAQTQFTPQSVLPAGRYFWRVASLDRNGRSGPFGALAQFDIEQELLRLTVAPQRTIGLQNNGRAEIASGTLNAKSTKITWVPGPAGLVYVAQIALDSRFSKVIESRRLIANELLMDNLRANTYFVRVKILRLDPAGVEIDSPWSSTEAVDVYPL